MSKRLLSFSRLLDLPENHSALVAVRDLADAIAFGRQATQPNPLYLHGSAGVARSSVDANPTQPWDQTRWPELDVKLQEGVTLVGRATSEGKPRPGVSVRVVCVMADSCGPVIFP